MLLLNLNNVLLIYHLGGAVKLFGFFTNWTVMATTIYFAVSLVATKPNASNSILALHHLLFQISMMMNFITMTVYWTTGLHQNALIETEGDPLKIINVYWAHMGPAFSVSLNFAFTDIILKESHVKMLWLITPFYAYNDYKMTLRRGKPQYFFFPWDDYWTVVTYAVLVIVFSYIYILLARITVSVKRGPAANRVREEQIAKLRNEAGQKKRK